ncbi:hypothetical protein C6P44_001264 [Monosporozyma unispora]|nr:hypothetical protein C6P44_001264 [Kazachstania unispora]
MVQINKSLLAAAAIAESVNAVTTLPITDDKVQNVELVVYVKDIVKNMAQYLSFRQANPDQPYPSQLNQIVLKALMAGGNDSWSTSLTGIDPATVEMMLTGVPWYSSRILPVLQDTLDSDNIAVVGINAEAAPATSSKIAPATSAPVAKTSSAVNTVAHSSSTSSQSSAAQSSAAQSSAAQSSAAQSSAAQSSAAQSSAAQSSAVQSSAVETSSAAQSSAAQSSAKKSSKSVAPVSSVASVKVSSSVNGTLVGKVTTKWNTVTSQYSNTTTITSCPPESATTVDITAKHTSEVTETVCDEVCHSKKSAAAAAATATTVTAEQTSTVISTICDEVCHSKKSAASAAKKTSTKAKEASPAPATEKTTKTKQASPAPATESTTKAQAVTPSSVAQVTKSETAATSSKPVIEQQTQNAAAKAYAGVGAGVLAAAALLI